MSAPRTLADLLALPDEALGRLDPAAVAEAIFLEATGGGALEGEALERYRVAERDGPRYVHVVLTIMFLRTEALFELLLRQHPGLDARVHETIAARYRAIIEQSVAEGREGSEG